MQTLTFTKLRQTFLQFYTILLSVFLLSSLLTRPSCLWSITGLQVKLTSVQAGGRLSGRGATVIAPEDDSGRTREKKIIMLSCDFFFT